ncbi:MAG: hypothetical protein ACFE0P_07425 [Oceanicaulis sp.]
MIRPLSVEEVAAVSGAGPVAFVMENFDRNGDGDLFDEGSQYFAAAAVVMFFIPGGQKAAAVAGAISGALLLGDIVAG